MPRVKRGSSRREKRKKLLSMAKGYFLGKSKLYKFAKEATDRAGNFAYVGRKRKKRDFRRLWIVRINAAARQHDISYSQLIAGLKTALVALYFMHLRTSSRLTWVFASGGILWLLIIVLLTMGDFIARG